LPNRDAFVIGSRGQESSIRRITNDIGVFVSLTQSVEDAKVVIIGMQRASVIDDFPYFDAPFCALSLLFHEFLVI